MQTKQKTKIGIFMNRFLWDLTGYFYLWWQHIPSVFFVCGGNAPYKRRMLPRRNPPVKWADKCARLHTNACVARRTFYSYKICGQNLINHARRAHLLTLWILARTKESPVCACKLLAMCVMMTEAFKCQHASANESKVTAAVALNKKRRRAAISLFAHERERKRAGQMTSSAINAFIA